MGKNNRQRRAAKQRKRASRERGRHQAGHRGYSGWDPGFSAEPPPPTDPMVAFMALAHAHDTGDDEAAERLAQRLSALPRTGLARELQQLLELQVSHLWTGGWQPAVLHRVVERQLSRDGATLLRCVLAAESASYEQLGHDVAPDWMHQLESVEASRWWETDRPYLRQLVLPWPALIHTAARLMNLLGHVPELPVLTPPPSEWRAGTTTAVSSNLPPGLLDKVRGLLAKAESSTFDAEAEAFTAKAQELMARHRINRVVLEAAERSAGDVPSGRRVFVDDPYAEAKAVLLDAISRANGGRAVWSKGLGFSTVFAFADELDVIEDLFTSLLVQATAALQREGSKQDRFGRSRTTRFRRSFLVAFATRVGRRLQEAVDTVVADAEAETGSALVPILTDRADAARTAAAEAFPELGHFSANATDREGWYAGTLFGDRADLGVGAPVEERTAS